MITLTATVQAGTTALTLGQVNFCDTAAASCTDIYLLGTAQLTSAGTAMLRFRPGPGSHSYKAVFRGTLAGATSASAAVGLTVGPRQPELQTTFAVASISGPVAASAYGTYALTASVGTKGAVPPSGTVSFSGTNVASGNAFSLPGTATLGPASGGAGFLNIPTPEPNNASADAPPLIAIGDFNEDGIPDIVSAPHGGIAVSLGNGDGTFAAPLIPNVDAADGINAFSVGDFNADGITDLVVDDEDTGQLTILLGKGDGTFTVGQSMRYPTTSLAVGDFNGDGKLDIALPGNPQPTILMGNGDGTFTAAPSQPQFVASQLVAADFNGDGKIDLAVTGYNGTAFTPITILLGNGDGTFTAPSTLPTDASFAARALAVGDFNGDGKPDLAVAAVANNPATTPDGKVSVFLGNGDGTFADRFDVALVAGSLTSLAAADLTGNGSSDLAAFGSVFLGNLTITTATADNVLPAGYDVIQTEYPGDVNNAPSSSTNAPAISVPQQIFSLTSDPITATPGGSANGSFSVTSSGFTGTLNLSCSISTAQNQENPPSCAVPSTVNFFSASGTVNQTYTITTQDTTPVGQYSITITAIDPVGGTTASTAAGVSVAANVPAPPPRFSLRSTAVTIPTSGSSGTSTITISPSEGFTGNVSLSCAVTGGPIGAVDAPACSVTAPPPITGATAVTATLTVSTTAASSAAHDYSRSQHSPRVVAIGGSGVAMAGLLLFGFPMRRRRTMLPLGLLLIATLIGTAIGCGGKNAAAPAANPGTTPGGYTVTVTGSSGAITATTAATVTVE